MIFPHTLRPADPEVADLAAHEADIANPHAVTKTQVGLSNVTNILNKLNGTVAPGVGDDTADGYSVGSLWHDTTNDKSYVCLDATGGAAVWVEITNVAPSLTLGDLTDVGTGTPTNGNVLTGNGSTWESVTPAAKLPEPGGTPTAGYVPVATGTGQASTWTAPTTSEPGPVMLFSAAVADGATTGTTTSSSPVMTTAGIAWTFAIDAAAMETLFGAGQWKITLKVMYSTENGDDDMKFQLHNLGAAAVIGTDPTLAGSVLYAAGSVSWATGLPTTLARLNICFYNGTASGAGHTIYGYFFAAYAEAV